MSKPSSKDYFQARLALYVIEHEVRPDVIIGLDEVGYGAWAGPLVVGGSITPCGWRCDGVRDSKKLTELRREKAVVTLREQGIPVFTLSCEAALLDEESVTVSLSRLNQSVAEHLIGTLPPEATYVVVMDGNKMNLPSWSSIKPVLVPKADVIVPAVSAASVVAKTTRDGYMLEYAKCYPQYDWESNKGYGTPKHAEGIRLHGMCPIHRRSYKFC